MGVSSWWKGIFTRYPVRAFPGDMLCYLTGMAFAVKPISQKRFTYSSCLRYSTPSSHGPSYSIPCPAHGTEYQGKTSIIIAAVPLKLEPNVTLIQKRTCFTPSTAATFPNSPSKLSAMMVLRDRLLALVKLTLVDVPSQYGRDHGDDQFGNFECNFGRMNEKRFVKVLIGIQASAHLIAEC